MCTRTGILALTTAGLLFGLAAVPGYALTITGQTIVFGEGEMGNWIDVAFTADEPIQLVDISWDFTPTIVWLDWDGISMYEPINNGVTSYAAYYGNGPGNDTQFFGVAFTGFDSEDYIRFTLDLDRGGGGTPFTEDYYGGIVTVEFSNGTILTTIFDTPVDWPNGAMASFGYTPPNLLPYPQTGWDYAVVPRGSDDAFTNNVPAPISLPGEITSTYWNVCGINDGDQLADPTRTEINLDGVYEGYRNWWYIDPGGWNASINAGPLFVRGGRHTLHTYLDAWDVVDEGDETDNDYGLQWVWTSNVLSPGTTVVRAAPPDRTGGWSTIPGGGMWYNCDGLRFSSEGWWNAVVVQVLHHVDDYDCRLHAGSTGATDGFTTNLGYSTRGPGLLDGVIVNRNTQGIANWDIGVLNASSSAYDYRATLVESEFISYGDSVTIAMAADEMLFLRELHINSTIYYGPLTVFVDVDPADGPVTALWLDKNFQTGDLLDYDGYDVTNENGHARLSVDINEQGYYCIVVFRDPANGTDPIDVVVEVAPTPPDFLPYADTGWYSPLVPRPANDATANDVALPDTLYGNVEETWYNFCVRNDSPTSTGTTAVPTGIQVDGVFGIGWGRSLSPYENEHFNNMFWPSISHVRGGRHTVAMNIDYSNMFEEIHEDNNLYGEQYCWSPHVMSYFTPEDREAPPERTGGWDHCPPGSNLWYNCDGLRLHPNSDFWRALAVMPHGGCNVDVQLHPPLQGVKDGFGESYALSYWGSALSDYVLVNNMAAENHAYDVGVLRGPGALDYTVEAVHAYYLGQPDNSNYGPYTLGAGHIMHLWEFYLPPGLAAFRLDNLTGSVDWGLIMHTADDPYQEKAQHMSGGIAWMNGPGGDEAITVDIVTEGYYCLSVWKVDTNSLGLEGSYRLRATLGITGMPDEMDIPKATRLVGAYPNPFNPQTTIGFDLAQPAEVRLAVYDLRGSLIRTLLAEHRGPGTYRVTWDGRDDHGRTQATGVYMARLTAGEVSQVHKLMLVK